MKKCQTRESEQATVRVAGEDAAACAIVAGHGDRFINSPFMKNSFRNFERISMKF